MSLFPNKTTAAAELRADLALGAGALIDLSSCTDDALYAKLLAAEADASKQLRVYLEPTVIIPEEAPQSEIDALEEANTRYAQEAAYDYDPDFFGADKWGFVVTKSRPIISVESMKFSYPAPTRQIWEIPHEWIRLDRKYGHIRLVPQAMSVSVPVAGFIMNALGGGRSIPFMIQIRYTAGLKNAAADYPELIDTIKKMAVLRLLQSAFLPQSGSISVDGMSQSKSIDLEKWHDGIQDKLDALRDQIHGVRTIVV